MVLLSLLPGLTVSAQEQKTTAARTVIVVDQAGPVIGASVVIKGTVSGASTDVNGVTTRWQATTTMPPAIPTAA